jgi:hypothetical protein
MILLTIYRREFYVSAVAYKDPNLYTTDYRISRYIFHFSILVQQFFLPSTS